MDQAMIGALLKAYGAPDNPANVNALMQRYASDPTAAERKIYGLQGQSDESGDGRDAILNQMIDATMQEAVPKGQVTVGAPVMESVANSSVPTQRNATAARQSEQYGPPPPEYSPGAGPLTRDIDSAAPAVATANTGESVSGDWFTELLGPILGILGAGGVASKMARGRNAPPATKEAPNEFTQDPRAATRSTTPESEGRPASPVDYRARHTQKRITDQSRPSNEAPPPVTEEEWRPAKAGSLKDEMTAQKKKTWKPALAKRAIGR